MLSKPNGSALAEPSIMSPNQENNVKYLIASLALFSFLNLSHAEETMTEKAQSTTNSAKRVVKKGVNRTAEALCGKLTGDSQAECLIKRAKNRVGEGTDIIQDKAGEIKNNVDSDQK